MINLVITRYYSKKKKTIEWFNDWSIT